MRLERDRLHLEIDNQSITDAIEFHIVTEFTERALVKNERRWTSIIAKFVATHDGLMPRDCYFLGITHNNIGGVDCYKFRDVKVWHSQKQDITKNVWEWTRDNDIDPD
jgi:hypothetical protein